MSRVQMSQADFEFLTKRTGSGPPRQIGQRPRTRKEDLPENILEGRIKSFLEARGWSCIRQQVGTYTPYRVLMALEQKTMTLEQAKRNIVRIGEKGAADWLAMRPIKAASAVQQVFFWEAKAPGKKPKPEQAAWLAARQATGTLAVWFDSFDDGFKGDFLPWYRATFEVGA